MAAATMNKPHLAPMSAKKDAPSHRSATVFATITAIILPVAGTKAIATPPLPPIATALQDAPTHGLGMTSAKTPAITNTVTTMAAIV
jgi:hypothetical protein